MKRLLAALLLLPALAFGAANDLFINQRDPTNQTTLNRTLTVPAADAIVGYTWKAGNTTAREPVMFMIGAGLQLNGQVLSAPGVPGAAPSWESVTGKPAVFPPAAHVHSATDVTTGVMALARLPALPIAQTTGLQTILDGKFSVPVGTADQYLRGDGSLAGFPALAPVATAGTYASLTGVPSTFAPAAHTQTWSTITATPTTLAGFGITDAVTQTALTTALAGKFNTPAGTTAQYVRGDGSLATLPAAKRIEAYAGTTNASGQVIVTYPTAFPAVPVVQPPAPALANQVWTTVSSTATGFTLQLNQRNPVSLLGVEVLLGATVPVTGANALVLVVAQ